MKISVITAVRDRAATVGQALDSVLSQSHRDLELVVQDGGSTDGTLDAVRARPDPRIALESAPDGGIYEAINRGITRCSGEAVGVMHSDDFFVGPDVLARVARAFAEPQVDGVYGDLDYVSAHDRDRVLPHWRSGLYDRRRLSRGWMPPHPTLYLRRRVFHRFGLYDPTFRIAADYEAMLRYLVQGDLTLAYIPRVLVRMRAGGESNRSLGRILRKSREDLRTIRRHGVGGLGTLALKNLGKVQQFFDRPA